MHRLIETTLVLISIHWEDSKSLDCHPIGITCLIIMQPHCYAASLLCSKATMLKCNVHKWAVQYKSINTLVYIHHHCPPAAVPPIPHCRSLRGINHFWSHVTQTVTRCNAHNICSQEHELIRLLNYSTRTLWEREEVGEFSPLFIISNKGPLLLH